MERDQQWREGQGAWHSNTEDEVLNQRSSNWKGKRYCEGWTNLIEGEGERSKKVGGTQLT